MPLYGYKSHVGIDRAHGLIRTWTVAHAAAHHGGQLERLLDAGNTAKRWPTQPLLGRQPGGAGQARHGPPWARPKPRGKPMPPNIRRGNATRGKVRAAVEHVFAAQKRRLKLVVRTVGIARATTKIGLANLADLAGWEPASAGAMAVLSLARPPRPSAAVGPSQTSLARATVVIVIVSLSLSLFTHASDVWDVLIAR